jgi:hypothetical protein
MKLTEETKQIKTVGRFAGSRQQGDEIYDHNYLERGDEKLSRE